MSRIGKLPVNIPDGVKVTIDGHKITAVGPLGTETLELRKEMNIAQEENSIVITRTSEDREVRALHGLSRTLVSNLVNGVKTGFEKKLEINGVGYRAAMQGKDLNLTLGYSHPILIETPEGIKIEVEAGTKIKVSGANKQLVGDVAAEIRSKRPPEVYKGKGVKYAGEYIRRKAGKAGKK